MKWILWVLILSSSTSFGQPTLEGIEFSDGAKFISSSHYGFSWTYKFGKNDYQLYLFYHYESPKTYLFEEGNYVYQKGQVVFKPKKKIICEITGVARFECRATDPAEGFLVSSDSLSEKEIIDLSFTDRVCQISTDADKLTFKDPSRPFEVFRQKE